MVKTLFGWLTLVILDGWGLGEISNFKLKFFDELPIKFYMATQINKFLFLVFLFFQFCSESKVSFRSGKMNVHDVSPIPEINQREEAELNIQNAFIQASISENSIEINWMVSFPLAGEDQFILIKKMNDDVNENMTFKDDLKMDDNLDATTKVLYVGKDKSFKEKNIDQAEKISYGLFYKNKNEIKFLSKTSINFKMIVKEQVPIEVPAKPVAEVKPSEVVLPSIASDDIPPSPPIVKGMLITNSLRPTWTWTSSGKGAGVYRFMMDEQDFASTTEIVEKIYTPENDLTPGIHTLYVQERDENNNWSDSGHFTTIIDTTATNAPILSGITETRNLRPTWTWKSAGGGNGKYRYKLDDGNLYSDAIGTEELSFTPTVDLSEGDHTFYIQENDNAENWSAIGSLTIKVDLTPPPAPLVSSAGLVGDPKPTWIWISSESGDGAGVFRFKVDHNDLENDSTVTTKLYYTSETKLIAGPHTLYIQEKDNAGNWSPVGKYEVTVLYPTFLSVDLGDLASDKIINRLEMRNNDYLIKNLYAYEVDTPYFYIAGELEKCDEISKTFYRDNMPKYSDLYLKLAGKYKVCVQLEKGQGFFTYGESGVFSITPNEPLVEQTPILDMMLNTYGTCIKVNSNNWKCFGGGSYGIMGNGANFSDDPGEMARIPYSNRYDSSSQTNLFSGLYNICYITALDNSLTCFGNSGSGELGTDSNSSGKVKLGVGRTAKEVSIGGNFICAILDNNDLKCWGNNSSGQLGIDSNSSYGAGGLTRAMDSLPVVNLGAGRFAKKIALGSQNHICAILDNDTLKCWGENGSGQLGINNTTKMGDDPGEMASLPTVDLGLGRFPTAIALGSTFSCALLDDRSVKCWGNSSYLGIETTNNYGSNNTTMSMSNLTAITFDNNKKVNSIMASNNNACALLEDFTVWCWGNNDQGQLGDDSGINSKKPVKVNLGQGKTAKKISFLANYGCAILDDDSIKCWGGMNGNDYNNLGNDSLKQHGYGKQMEQLTPINFNSSVTIKEIIAGKFSAHTCAIFSDHSLKCWGENGNGQLGLESKAQQGDDPSEIENLPAVFLGDGRTVQKVSLGSQFTCALLDDGSVKCWGLGNYGQLGQENTSQIGISLDQMKNLQPIKLGQKAMDISAGSAHACAVLEDRSLKCWGYNSSGQLGYNHKNNIGDKVNSISTLVSVNLLGQAVKSVSLGQNHTCVLLMNNKIKCWGYNAQGQLGLESKINQGDDPNEMENLPYVYTDLRYPPKNIQAGNNFTCVLLDNDSVKCWGENNQGQLGQDSNLSYGPNSGDMAVLKPINFGLGRTVKSLSVGGSFSCALLDNDRVKCWGNNNQGQLGQNSRVIISSPDMRYALKITPTVFVGQDRSVKSVSAGFNFTCAILDNNQTKCWGNNGNGQLGQNSKTPYGASMSMENVQPIYILP